MAVTIHRHRTRREDDRGGTNRDRKGSDGGARPITNLNRETVRTDIARVRFVGNCSGGDNVCSTGGCRGIHDGQRAVTRRRTQRPGQGLAAIRIAGVQIGCDVSRWRVLIHRQQLDRTDEGWGSVINRDQDRTARRIRSVARLDRELVRTGIAQVRRVGDRSAGCDIPTSGFGIRVGETQLAMRRRGILRPDNGLACVAVAYMEPVLDIRCGTIGGQRKRFRGADECEDGIRD